MTRSLVTLRAAEISDAPFLAELWSGALRRAEPQEHVADLEQIIKTAATSPEQRLVPLALITFIAWVTQPLVAPMLPHLAEEAWAALGNDGLIAGQPWPSHDLALLVDDEVTIAVQVMGKLRDTLTVAKGTPKDTLEALALASEKVQRAMDSATPKKMIVVPDRLVNIVL